MKNSHQPTARPAITSAEPVPIHSGAHEYGANTPCSPAPWWISPNGSSSGRGSIRREVTRKYAPIRPDRPPVSVSPVTPSGSCQFVMNPYTIASGTKKNAPAPNSQVSTFTSLQSSLNGVPTRSSALVVRLHVRAAQGLVGQPVRRHLRRRRHLGVMQVEGRPLGPDPRHRGEVVPRRRA